MRISENTRYEDFKAFEGVITEESQKALEDAAERVYLGADGFWGLTIEKFLSIQKHGIDVIGWKNDGSVYSKYFIDALQKFIDAFTKSLENLTIQPTPQEQNASSGCLKVTFAEGMLTFVRSYFGLHSFREAEQITLADLILAKKDAYNEAVFNRNMAKQRKKAVKK